MDYKDFGFHSPILNASGSLGFSPTRKVSSEFKLGGFFTNPVSLRPRTPARGTRFLRYPGGVLLHTGFPNPGFREVVRRHRARWVRTEIPVFVHILADHIGDVEKMVERLEEMEGVSGIEISFPPQASVSHIREMTRRAVGELTVIARVPPVAAIPLAQTAMEAGAGAISIGPSRGALPTEDGGRVTGRLYGPGNLPLGLATLVQLSEMGVPVIGGGAYSAPQVAALRSAGAIAVQLDTVLWGNGFSLSQ